MSNKHPKLFQDPKIDYPIYDLDLSFNDYISQSKVIIANTRQDLHKNNAELIIEANAPFELKPKQKAKYGALLIHGLLDSPYIMRDIGDHLCEKGMLVRSIMLPGHGTVPGALLNTDYTEWLQAVRYGIATLQQDVEKIFLVGFSTGASLSLYHAVEDHLISGLIMIAPAIKINSPFAFATNWHRVISWAWQRANWFHITKEIDYVKYCSVTFNAVYQVYRLANEVQKIGSAKLANYPLFAILSNEDKIVCSYASTEYFKQNKNPFNRMLMYSNKPLAFDDKRILVRNSVYPELNILSFSHITMPVAPANPHYGEHGDYPLASHHDKNIRYGAFDKIDTFWRNLLYNCKLSKQRYRRLTYNPDFNFMMTEIEKFIFSEKTSHPKIT